MCAHYYFSFFRNLVLIFITLIAFNLLSPDAKTARLIDSPEGSSSPQMRLCFCTMGNGIGGHSQTLSRQIDKTLLLEKKKESKIIKLLLLGGSESGKSTFAKQMKILHMNGFSENELEYFRHLIYHNCVEGMLRLIEIMAKLKIKPKSKTFEENVTLLRMLREATEWSIENITAFASIIEDVWTDKSMQECWQIAQQRNAEYHLPDNMFYFTSHLKRICSFNYVADYDDILHSRIITTGIVEMDFAYKQLFFRLVDVGGQRSQRRKWIHCFDNVTAILFMVAISEYDLTLAENPAINRMQDSLNLFEAIITNQLFYNTHGILFLNKKDVFELKITKSPLNACFPDYTGPNTFEDASEFIREKFMRYRPPTKNVYCNFTNAVDTRNIDYVFDAAVDIIFTKNMFKSGLS